MYAGHDKLAGPCLNKLKHMWQQAQTVRGARLSDIKDRQQCIRCNRVRWTIYTMRGNHFEYSTVVGEHPND